MLNYKNLMAVHYDGSTGLYELEFTNQWLTVQATDHPQAKDDEDYFDRPEVIENIIAEANN